MQTIRIFIASSSELKAERDALRQYLSTENDRLHRRGLYLELVQWEYFLDAVSQNRLQDAYNAALKQCDICITLFHTPRRAIHYRRVRYRAGAVSYHRQAPHLHLLQKPLERSSYLA
jgi:hypothetical protein